MSLADELLADLEDLDDDIQEDAGNDFEENGEFNGDDIDMDADEEGGVAKGDSVHSIAKLFNSTQLNRILSSITQLSSETAQPRKQILGPVEFDPEYKTLVEANNITQEIDSEIGIIHKYCRDLYSARFPELEQLVLNPLDYIRTVKAMMNVMDVTKVDLSEILAPATIMVVSVTASTTQGKPLDDVNLAKLMEACTMALGLLDAKNTIFDFVESRMYFLAPNLTQICGATTAAKLMGLAGGLASLSKMPACNIMVLGATKKSLSGFSSAASGQHQGVLYFSDFVQSQPTDYRRKAARLVAAKAALAARIDAHKDETTSTAALGLDLRMDIERKIEKAQMPPPAKLTKALARPDEKSKKKRGGRRQRKMKEDRALSEAAKAQNRMTFAEIGDDSFQDEMGYSEGQYGKSGSGKIRLQETKKAPGQLSKRLQRELAKGRGTSTVRRTPGGVSIIKGVSTGGASGTSSVAFTPIQGLEINISQKDEKASESNRKYFGATAGFVNVSGGEFKVPSLPMHRK